MNHLIILVPLLLAFVPETFPCGCGGGGGGGAPIIVIVKMMMAAARQRNNPGNGSITDGLASGVFAALRAGLTSQNQGTILVPSITINSTEKESRENGDEGGERSEKEKDEKPHSIADSENGKVIDIARDTAKGSVSEGEEEAPKENVPIESKPSSDRKEAPDQTKDQAVLKKIDDFIKTRSLINLDDKKISLVQSPQLQLQPRSLPPAASAPLPAPQPAKPVVSQSVSVPAISRPENAANAPLVGVADDPRPELPPVNVARAAAMPRWNYAAARLRAPGAKYGRGPH